MNKKALFLLFSTLLCDSVYAVNRDWMSKIPDSRLVSAMSIPGTHDSAAYQTSDANRAFVPDWSWETQTKNISEQLSSGVRFFDIRCRHQSNACVLHHGRIYLEQNLGSVLSAMYSFLQAHPGETILMSVKDKEWDDGGAEPDAPGFPQTMRNYVNADPQRWYTGQTIPTLGQNTTQNPFVEKNGTNVRGRIVLIRRYGNETAYGIDATDWSNNTAFRTSNLYVQDYYDLGLQKSKAKQVAAGNKKWQDIFAALMQAKGGATGTGPYLFLNFTSYVTFGSHLFSNSVPDIEGYKYVNPKLSNFMKNNNYRWGVMVMDHPSTDLINSIISNNK